MAVDQDRRGSGVLLHPTSLPSKEGIGTLGKSAKEFIDFLKASNQKYWQICPLGPTGYGDSPYQCFSAFAGNPLLIDLETVVSMDLIEKQDLKKLNSMPKNYTEYGAVIPEKMNILKKAFNSFQKVFNEDPKQDISREFTQFCQENENWLHDYAIFMVLKEMHDHQSWDHWDKKYRKRDLQALHDLEEQKAQSIDFQKFIQFLFFNQWSMVREYARKRGVKIIGDMPIFVAYDSVDVWSHRDLFILDEDGIPSMVAGVPPDYFSETGQLWGNPLYNWKLMKKNGFTWWITVLKSNLEKYDLLRIDHFRGFEAYWAVPYGDKTAKNGTWEKAPGKELFEAVRATFGQAPIIAEDLGHITDEVVELIKFTGFPRMKVLQFAFDSTEENNYIPHSFDHNCVVYTGTHDNNTVMGWFKQASREDKRYASEYLNFRTKRINWEFIRGALASVADLAIIPLQDILGLGSESRFNTPGTLGGNWQWRYKEGALSEKIAKRLGALTKCYGRD